MSAIAEVRFRLEAESIEGKLREQTDFVFEVDVQREVPVALFRP